MNAKFSAVPIEEDTEVLARVETTFGPYDAVHERWRYEAVKAESVILLSDDVANISDGELESALRASGLVQTGTEVTVTRGDSGYTFLNFNFVVA
jgi:hypothetical protein